MNKNSEQEFYAPENVYVRKGCLVLKSERKGRGGKPYVSGLVDTRRTFSQLYGRFEVRARLPRGQGIWPAHWMLPVDGSWPPEIDFMEMLGHEPNKVYQTVHFGTCQNHQQNGRSYAGPDFSRDFHTFAVEWEPNEIRFYVDGRRTSTVRENVPNKPFFLILNTAVGGDWPKYPDATTVFPQYHYIDYVRVWTRDTTNMHQLSVRATNGKVRRTPEEPWYTSGQRVTLQAEPDIGYRLTRWEGDAEGNANPLTLTMDRPRTVIAVFEPDPNAGELLSQGCVATASSSKQGDQGPEKAVDGDPTTRWASDWSDPQWLTVDLGRSCAIEALRLRWEIAAGLAYEIQVSEDGTHWNTVHSCTDGRGEVETIRCSATGRYVRLAGTRRLTEWGYSLWEMEVYGRSIS